LVGVRPGARGGRTLPSGQGPYGRHRGKLPALLRLCAGRGEATAPVSHSGHGAIAAGGAAAIATSSEGGPRAGGPGRHHSRRSSIDFGDDDEDEIERDGPFYGSEAAAAEGEHAAAASAATTASDCDADTDGGASEAARSQDRRVAARLSEVGAVSVLQCPLPSAEELADRAVRHFVHARGEGLSFPSQRRTVGYVAQLVRERLRRTLHALVDRGNEAEGGAGAAAEPAPPAVGFADVVEHAAVAVEPGDSHGESADAAPSWPDSAAVPATPPRSRVPSFAAPSREPSSCAIAPAAAAVAATPLLSDLLLPPWSGDALVEWAAEAVRGEELSAPEPPPITILNVVLNGIPIMPGTGGGPGGGAAGVGSGGGITPNLIIRNLPHQHEEAATRYESAWAEPQLQRYVHDDECIVFKVGGNRAATT
jgi:hypothetical protein